VPRAARILAGILLAIVIPTPAAAQDAAPPRPPSSPDPFADGRWSLELGGQAFAEAWNYNASHEDLYGMTAGFAYGCRNGLMFVAAIPMFYVSQRTTDTGVLGITGGVRWRVAKARRASPFLELAVGVSRSELYVPPRGTRFNYIFQPGAGVVLPLRNTTHLVATFRWLHLSNNSLAGRSRNPDIEALGVHLGVLLAF
jgi:hypothetical protein